MSDIDYSKCFRRICVLGEKESGKTTLINLVKGEWGKYSHIPLPEFIEIDGTELNVDVPATGEWTVVMFCHDGNRPFRGLKKLINGLRKAKNVVPALVITKSDLNEETDEKIKKLQKNMRAHVYTVNKDNPQKIAWVTKRLCLMLAFQITAGIRLSKDGCE